MGGTRIAVAGACAAAAAVAVAIGARIESRGDAAAGTGGTTVGRLEREGLAVAVTLSNAAGGPAVARARGLATVTIADAATGAPVPGLRPLAWIDRPDPELACETRLKQHLGGLLSTRAEVDLNGQLVLVLNEDASLSVIDPRVALRRTKLRSLISLAGRAGDWALLPRHDRLLVSLPGAGKVAVIDTRALRLRGNVETGGRPGRLHPLPAGALLGDDDGGRVLLLDPDGAIRATVATGPGAQRFAGHGREVWVAPGGAALLMVLDGDGRELARLATTAPAAAIAAHETAGSVYVALEGRDELAIWDGKRRTAAGTIAGLPGVRDLRFDPEGRWLFAVTDDALAAIDPATATVRHRIEGLDGPDGLAFTPDFLHVREGRAGALVLVPRGDLDRAGPPALVRVPVAQNPGAPSVPVLAPPLALAAAPGTVIVPSPLDRALFFYTEGMMAPAGSLQNYGREPLAVLSLDQSLAEIAPGVHAAPLELPPPGRWELSILLDSPRIVACFPFELSGPGEERAPALRLEPAFAADTRFRPGREVTVPVRLAHRTGGPVPEVRLRTLVFRAPGTWQRRGEAVPLGGGLHEVRFVPPGPGRYRIVASGREPGLEPRSLGVVEVPVVAGEGEER